MSTKVLFQEICDKKINPILYNHLSAKIIDMILGLLALKFFIKHESQIVEIIQILIHVKYFLFCMDIAFTEIFLGNNFQFERSTSLSYGITYWLEIKSCI